MSTIPPTQTRATLAVSLDIVRTWSEAARQARPPLLVLASLEAFMDEHGIGHGPIDARMIGDGHSNVTYLIVRGDATAVLRRPPRPPLPPSAHDVLREARVLQALDRTLVPVAKVVATCADEGVIGVPFYVMEHLEGEVLTDAAPPALAKPEERERMGAGMVDALVDLHAVDWRACGLEGFGRESGYLERQLRRLGALWDATRTRELPAVTELQSWLECHRPESGPTTIVHGDFRIGNLMFSSTAPAQLLAIFDWEMATLGDPLADLGYFTATYAQSDEPKDAMTQLSAVTLERGFPDRDDLARRYASQSGRSIDDLPWYQVLALWKSCAFLEGSYGRYLTGTTDDPWFADLARHVPELAERALALTR